MSVRRHRRSLFRQLTDWADGKRFTVRVERDPLTHPAAASALQTYLVVDRWHTYGVVARFYDEGKAWTRVDRLNMDPPEGPIRYAVDPDNNKVHVTGCKKSLGNTGPLVYYGSVEPALADGFTECRTCRPGEFAKLDSAPELTEGEVVFYRAPGRSVFHTQYCSSFWANASVFEELSQGQATALELKPCRQCSPLAPRDPNPNDAIQPLGSAPAGTDLEGAPYVGIGGGDVVVVHTSSCSRLPVGTNLPRYSHSQLASMLFLPCYECKPFEGKEPPPTGMVRLTGADRSNRPVSPDGSDRLARCC